MQSDVLVARTPEDRACADGLQHAAGAVNPSSPPDLPRKRRQTVNPVPLAERVLIDLDDAAKILSVSTRTMKRIAADNPQLVCLVSRRRLFVRAKLLAWVEAGGDARPARR